MNQTTSIPLRELLPLAQATSKADREQAAFRRLLPGLLTTHAGRFVAIHEEQVIDDDDDDIALVRRVHARVGYVPIFVGLVTATPPNLRLPRYREVRPQE